MKWALLAVGIVVVVAICVTAIGALLPRDHVAASSVVIAASPDDIWKALTDIEQFPRWRAVSEVQRLDSDGGPRRWREVSRFGALSFEEVQAIAPRLLTSRITDTDQGFGGTWTWEITRVPDGSRVTVTERGFVTNPIFRFLSRFVFGYYRTQEEYLRALGQKFGMDVTPVRA
jgi:polyketide cyclase/dehydrase/lipid transport protein